MKRLKTIISAALILCVLLSLCPAARAEGDDARFAGKTWDEVVHEFLAGLNVPEDRISIGYRNLVTGEEHYHNPGKYMVAASMFKVPLTMIYAEKVYNGELAWTDSVGGVSLEVLVEGCIIDSNNHFAQILWSDLGNGSYRTYRERLAPYMGEDAATVDPKYYENNLFTPEQMIYALNLLYTQQERFPRIIELMQRAEPETYFKRSEKRFDIAHKFGFLTPEWHVHVNDCAIAFTDDPIAFVCSTDNVGNALDVLDGLPTLLCDYTQYHTAQRKLAEAAQDAAVAPLRLSRPEAASAASVTADTVGGADDGVDETQQLFRFIQRVAAITAALLLLAGLVHLCRRNRIWWLWVPLALIFAAGAVFASLHITSSGALLNRETVSAVTAGGEETEDSAALDTANAFLDALCRQQDYETAYGMMRGYASFGLEQDAADAVDQMVREAMRQQLDYAVSGEIAAGPSQATLPVTLSGLDLAQLEAAIRAETRNQLAAASASRPAEELYDSEGAFLPEIVQQAYEAAASAVLAHAGDYRQSAELSLQLVRSGGVWYVQPDETFAAVVDGGAAAPAQEEAAEPGADGAAEPAAENETAEPAAEDEAAG